MKKLLAISIVAIIVLGLISATPFQHTFAVSKTQKKIDKLISSKLPNKDWTKIQALNITLTTTPHDVIKVYNKTGTTPPPPNPTPTGSCAIPDVNHSKFLRVAVTGDTKTNGKEFQVIHDCHVDVNIVPGDLWYTSTCNEWLSAVEKLGWTKNNTDLGVGNHDSDGACIRNWLGQTSTYHQIFFTDKLAVTTLNGNTDLKCTSAQYQALKPKIESSDAMYNLVQVHQPFLTVKNNHHGPNGEFSCWHALFKANGIDMVLQAHVHNYQRFLVDGIEYTVGPPGTHDTGSGLYTLDSKTDQLGHDCLKCLRDNGVMLLDLQIADPHVHQIIGNTINLKGQILDHFVLSR